jgi:hypothetical protein
MKRIILTALCSLLLAGMAWAQTGEQTGTPDTAGEQPMSDQQQPGSEQPMSGQQESQTPAMEQPMSGQQESQTPAMEQPMSGQQQEMTFESMDQDSDMNVSLYELQQQYPDVDREQFRQWDQDNDGVLDQNEFEQAKSDLQQSGGAGQEQPMSGQQESDTSAMEQPMSGQQQEMSLEDLDQDGDQNVSLSELQQQYPDVDQEKFQQWDQDNDGMLNQDEFEQAKSDLQQSGGTQ